MNALFLYGANCTSEVWLPIKDLLTNIDITYVKYPHEILCAAGSVTDITRWVYSTYGNSKYNLLLGHSMGGMIALELAADFGMVCDKIILVETNLRPAKEFYRNLLMPKHMENFGNEVIEMLQSEAPFYLPELKKSIQENFDYTGFVEKINQQIFAIYGDRGLEGYKNRINDLCLDKSTTDKLLFSFVKNSCHMPMLENSTELANIILAIVS